jgi:hypothetical protein
LLGCEVAAIKAVTEVEGAGQGMLANGKPRILFEPHIFWKQLSAKGIDPNQYAEKNSNILYLPGKREITAHCQVSMINWLKQWSLMEKQR